MRTPAEQKLVANLRVAQEALERAREWMLLDDTYGNAEKFRVDLEFVDVTIAALKSLPWR